MTAEKKSLQLAKSPEFAAAVAAAFAWPSFAAGVAAVGTIVDFVGFEDLLVAAGPAATGLAAADHCSC